jgi:hypothetical protein
MDIGAELNVGTRTEINVVCIQGGEALNQRRNSYNEV